MARILVVDDEAVVLRVIYNSLTRFGHEVKTALSPKDALTLFSEGKYDLVILDIRMPGMDGFELGKILREKDPDIPLLFTTGDTGSEYPSLSKGPRTNLLPKPYTGNTIRQEAEKMLLEKAPH